MLSGSGLGQCVSLAFVCDGVEQCLNGRDEADCCNNYCDDGVTCIQDEREGTQCDLINGLHQNVHAKESTYVVPVSSRKLTLFNCSICDGYDDCPGDRFEYQEGCGKTVT